MKVFLKIAFLLISLLVNISFAQPIKVLIVNADAAVQRYEKISTEFKKTLQKNTYQWIELNLEGRDNPEKELQKIIEQENPQIIYCIGSKAYLVSQKQVKNEILVFSAAINWQRLNISDRTYGIANELSPAQEITYLRMFFPEIKKIGLLYSNEFNQEYIETIRKEAATLNVEIVAQEISNPAMINSTLSELLPKIDMFWMISDPVVLENKDTILQIFQTAKQQKKPVYAYTDVYIKYGAVLSVSSDAGTLGRQAANLIDSLQQRKLAGNVQLPAGTHISLNLCAVEELKINLNKDALSSVDQLVTCPTQ